jgi:hypothetical protein
MENQLVSMAQQFTGLPMDSLIGGPLNAAANANAAMAATQVKFMLDTCFQKVEITPPTTPPTYNYTPIMIDMILERAFIQPADPNANPPIPEPTILPVKTTIHLPLLTILPINSLAVDDVTITFEMEVKSSYSEESSQSTEKETKASADWEVKFGWGPISATVKGSASYDQKDSSNFKTHYEKSNSAKYTVSVHAGQLPLPKGVNTIIEAYTQAIQPITMPKATP